MMTRQRRLVEGLREEMRREIDMLEAFAGIAESLGGLVTKRDWPGMEQTLERLNEMGWGIEDTERRRHEIYTELKRSLDAEEGASFRQVLAKLPDGDARILSSLQAEMRIALVRVKSRSNGLIYYLSCMRESTSRILEEVFPQRKGKIYAANGGTRENLEHPHIVNQSL